MSSLTLSSLCTIWTSCCMADNDHLADNHFLLYAKHLFFTSSIVIMLKIKYWKFKLTRKIHFCTQTYFFIISVFLSYVPCINSCLTVEHLLWSPEKLVLCRWLKNIRPGENLSYQIFCAYVLHLLHFWHTPLYMSQFITLQLLKCTLIVGKINNKTIQYSTC